MPNFNRNDVISLTLNSNDSLLFTGTAKFTVYPVGGTSQQGNVSGVNQPLGPYGGTVTLVLTCDTAGSYIQSNNGTPILFNARLGVTGVGDSLMAFQDAVRAGGTVSGQTSQGIMSWAMSNLAKKIPYFIVSNRGTGSKTIDLVITEQLPNALADNSDILWVHAGVNNLNPSIDATLPTVAEIISRMDYLLSICQNVPIVILDAITPLGLGSISGAYPRRADIPLINTGYKALAVKYPNVVYNDIYTPLAQDATSGLAIDNVTIASDKIHLSTYGAYVAGMASKATLESIPMALSRYHRASTSFQMPRITGTSGTKTANSGTINGDIATGYTCDIVTNSSGVVITGSVDEANQKQRLRIQNGNASATVIRFGLTSLTDLTTGLVGGDIVRVGGTIDVISQSGLYRHDMGFIQNPSGVPVAFGSFQKSTGEDGTGDSFPFFPPAPYTLSPDCHAVLTTTPTSLRHIFTFELASGGDVTVDLSKFTFEEVVAY